MIAIKEVRIGGKDLYDKAKFIFKKD